MIFSQPRDPRQRAGDRHRAGQSGAPRRASDDRRGPPGPRLRPSGARRAAPALSRWCGRAMPCRCTASGGICPRMRRWRRRRARRRSCWRTATSCSLAPGTAGGGGQRAGRPAGAGRQSRLVPLDGGVMAARRRMLFNGVVRRQPGGGRGRPAAGRGRASARPACSSRTIRRPSGIAAEFGRGASPICPRRCAATMRR